MTTEVPFDLVCGLPDTMLEKISRVTSAEFATRGAGRRRACQDLPRRRPDKEVRAGVALDANPAKSSPVASIVIPAHDEASVLARLLCSLASAAVAHELEVVVVANGCSDRTADVARSFADRLPGLRVLETTEAGKRHALNQGDRRAESFPRVFVDADVEFGPGALDALVDGLTVDSPRVGAPQIAFDLSGASAWVRAFYGVFARLPYVTDGLIGLGVYGLSEQGRARFDVFPDFTADDLFVQRLFGAAERIQPSGVFVVRTPRSLSALVKVRTRVAAGNRQLAQRDENRNHDLDGGRSTGSTVRALATLVGREPMRVGGVLVYVAVTVLSRWRARQFDASVWHRDETSRA